jgi:hypothetical protein
MEEQKLFITVYRIYLKTELQLNAKLGLLCVSAVTHSFESRDKRIEPLQISQV